MKYANENKWLDGGILPTLTTTIIIVKQNGLNRTE
jgi:hypothetical protein